MENNTFDEFSVSGNDDFFMGSQPEQSSAPVSEAPKTFPVKMLAMAGAAIAALIAIIVLLCSMGNSYKTPIKDVEKLLNTKSFNKIIDRVPTLLNGFGESEAKKALKILKKSDIYKDNIEDIEEQYDELMEMVEDEIGKNYKIKIKIDDKEKMDKDDVKEFKEMLKEAASEGLDAVKEIDNDMLEELADEAGMSEKEAKKLKELATKVLKKAKSAKVTAGYELDLVVKITGKELDEPEEMDLTVCVYKVDGRWILDPTSLLGGGMGALMGMGGLGF
jgi:hypothetical protein